MYDHPAYANNPDLPGSQLKHRFRTAGPSKGDPAKFAKLLFKLVAMEKPPMRVPAGKDSWFLYEQTLKEQQEEWEKMDVRSLSEDLQFDE